MIRFDSDIGEPVQLDHAPIPVGKHLDLPAALLARRLWEWRGPHLNWVELWWPPGEQPRRTWAPLRAQHRCPNAPPLPPTPRTNPTIRKEPAMTDPLDQFDNPGPLDAIKWADHEGRLALVTPLHVDKDVPKPDGDGVRDVIIANVVILDGPDAPRRYTSTPVFPAYLQGQLRRNVGTGRSCLGRVTKDTSRQQRGYSAPWILADPTDTDKAAARTYLNSPLPAGNTGQAPPF